MQDRYPIGSTIPVEPWLVDGLRQLAQDRKGPSERGLYLVQRYQAWRVYPVKVGRWHRKSYLEDDIALNDPVGGAWWAMRAVVGAGSWVLRPSNIQLLDPGTGQPIGEHFVNWNNVFLGQKGFPGPETRAMAVLGDPRVCGLFAVFGDQHPPAVAWGNSRQANNVKWTPENIEKQTAKLAAAPYKDFSFKEDGPWFVDHPEPPAGGKTRWGRFRPGG